MGGIKSTLIRDQPLEKNLRIDFSLNEKLVSLKSNMVIEKKLTFEVIYLNFVLLKASVVSSTPESVE